MAQRYGADPWAILHEWTLGRFDVNAYILRHALEEERRAMERASRRGR